MTMGWISVKDGLPTKTMEDVLVVCSDGDILKAFVYSDGTWAESRESIPLDNVEYWMPLPELPDELKQKLFFEKLKKN